VSFSVRFTPLRIAATGCAALATLLAGALPAGAAAPAPVTTTDPAQAAAGWLAGQFVDGTHLEGSYGGSSYVDYGTTADAVYALAAAKAGKDVIQSAVSYLATNADAYVDFDNTSGYGPSDGATAKLALAAQVSGADPAAFGGRNLLAILKANECTAVTEQAGKPSTPCVAVGSARNVFSSISESFVVLTEARAGGTATPSPAAVDYFLSLQCADGGFTSSNLGGPACTPDPDATAYAIMALQALGSQPAALASALSWLAGQRNAAGYWVAQGIPDVDTTGLAAAALDAAGQDMSASRAWLASQQMTTGPTVGPGASRGALKYAGKFSATMSPKATADGLVGMVRGGSLATLTASGASAGTALLALPPATATESSVTQGGRLTLTAGGFSPGEQVAVTLHSTPVSLGSVTATGTGAASITFTVPTALPAGSHTVSFLGQTSGLTATSAAFTVLAAPAPQAAGTTTVAAPASAQPVLAATGRNDRALTGYGIAGGLLIAAGAGLLYAGRRRLS
jgi:hypothetical protein